MEPCTDPASNPFQRPRPQLDLPLLVIVDGEPEYEVERLLKREKLDVDVDGPQNTWLDGSDMDQKMMSDTTSWIWVMLLT